MNSFLVVQIDLLAEISQSPRILSEVDAALKAKQIKGDVDEYLKVILTQSNNCSSSYMAFVTYG